MYKSQLKRFTFYKNGDEGRGIGGVIRQYYLSTSKVAPTGGEWMDEAPSWEYGKYLWIRDKISYTDGDTVYTTPYCDSSWEAVKNVDAQILAWCMDNDRTYINGAKIYTGTITADKLKVNSLSSISADIGTVTAGTIKGVEIIGGSIKSDTTIDVTTDLRVGNAIYLGDQTSAGSKYVYFTNESYIRRWILSTGTEYLAVQGKNVANLIAQDGDVYARYSAQAFSDEGTAHATITATDGTSQTTLDVTLNGISMTSPNEDVVDFFEDMVIFPNQTWSSGEVDVGGYVTGDTKTIWFSIPVGQRMVGINSVECTSLKMNLRTVGGGYVGEGYTSGGYEYVGHSNYTITAEIMPNTNTILVSITQTVAYGTTNNTPISVSILDSTFEFN